MSHPYVRHLTLLAVAAIAACSSMPANNAMLDRARSDYRAVQAQPQSQNYAGAELRQAGDALARAEAAFSRNDDTPTVNNLAYLATQRSALAQEAIGRKAAEASVAQASTERDKIRLAARTQEADSATQAAGEAQRDAQNAQRQSEASQRQAVASQRQSEASQQQANLAQQQAAASQLQAGDAERRNAELETQLRDLNAKKTDRGMVVTLGDVLFDTGKSELKPGGLRSVEQLSVFLKAYPLRKAMVEGYTDSVGSEGLNQELSGRRAEAVRSALAGMGVGMDRIATHAYGERYPVAGNESSGGRQMNRRVEVVLSDENGSVAPR